MEMVTSPFYLELTIPMANSLNLADIGKANTSANEVSLVEILSTFPFLLQTQDCLSDRIIWLSP